MALVLTWFLPGQKARPRPDAPSACFRLSTLPNFRIARAWWQACKDCNPSLSRALPSVWHRHLSLLRGIRLIGRTSCGGRLRVCVRWCDSASRHGVLQSPSRCKLRQREMNCRRAPPCGSARRPLAPRAGVASWAKRATSSGNSKNTRPGGVLVVKSGCSRRRCPRPTTLAPRGIARSDQKQRSRAPRTSGARQFQPLRPNGRMSSVALGLYYGE